MITKTKKMFKNIEYGEGSHPVCKFWLSAPIDVRNFGTVGIIIAKLSDNDSRIDVWTVSKEVGRVYLNPLMKRLQNLEGGQELLSHVNEAIKLTQDYTKKSRDENYISNDGLWENVRKIVSEIVYSKLNENKRRNDSGKPANSKRK
jgi:hypothetical protein